MALVGAALKAKMKTRIEKGLAKNFPEVAGTPGYSGVSKEMWSKIADAVSDAALDIVDEIVTNAQVVPGIPVITNGSPSTHSGQTVAPGKIR